MLASSITECVFEQMEDFASDPDRGRITSIEALEFCTEEGDLLGPMLDDLCAGESEAPFCTCLGREDCFESFYLRFVRPCATSLRSRFDCAFGLTFGSLREGTPTLFKFEERTLRLEHVSDALLAEQVLRAVGSSYEAATLEQAFSSVDRGEVNVVSFWEGTNGLAYTAVEYGAGDNSYGSIFAFGTTQPVATIADSDLYDASEERNLGCRIPYGPRWSPCVGQDACALGLRCEGMVLAPIHGDPEDGVREWVAAGGKCVALAEDEASGSGVPCSATMPCPIDRGLLCSTIASGDSGQCRPAWMFGQFSFPGGSMPIPTSGVSEYPVVVSGLATVPEEAVFSGTISFQDFTKLRLGLMNPVHRTIVTFFDGPELGESGVRALLGGLSGEFHLRHPVAVPGDESVNGEWRLIVETTPLGTSTPPHDADDMIHDDATLTISSRYD